MKQITLLICTVILITSCETTRQLSNAGNTGYPAADTLITTSLFSDRASTISEENIHKILDGSYQLPQHLRVVIVNLGQWQQNRFYKSDEEYLKSQQLYLDLFTEKFKKSARVSKLSVIPDLLVSKSPSFTSIREAAVRMQADVVVAYSITGDIYSKYKFFTKPDIKAFATTQLVILDIRTGLIPFSTIITKDVLSQRKKEELNDSEASTRIQNEAVLLTIEEIGEKVSGFLTK